MALEPLKLIAVFNQNGRNSEASLKRTGQREPYFIDGCRGFPTSTAVFGALAMPAAINRWTNVVLGVVYAAIIALTMVGAPPFYILFGVVEILLSAAIVFYALRWPIAA